MSSLPNVFHAETAPAITAPVQHEFLGRRSYDGILTWMENTQRERREGARPDTIFYLEHNPVVTVGRATPAEHIDDLPAGMPRVEVPRGGQATYHGPGQLIGYPIIDLRRRANGLSPDIHAFLRALEDGLISLLQVEFALPAMRFRDLTGVWIDDETAPRKIASIGISARKWISGHGFALNSTTDLEVFRSFVPCGISDFAMTSLEAEMSRAASPRNTPQISELARLTHAHLTAALQDAGWCLPEEQS